ncbi:unconventional myosin-Va isoform X2 [Patella vulgata]|uniref:unconventional myosin-Va isoform X2 n=1 Tax=Patella vulgata TaxID=6465 RepID=UPI0021803C42|nr:unconventional myosin-Va isoform X2 [Patella vulgata]
MSTKELYTKGARIWIPDNDIVWRAAELKENYSGQDAVAIQYEDGEDSKLKIDKENLPHLRNPDILIGENDLTSLSYLNEPEVLYNLKLRFLDSNLIYTYCGIVLVAINPYEQLDIYSNDIIQAYSGQDMGAMDPHIFAVAEEAYKQMSRFEKNQSIIVSGESGAGKTVSAKYAMRFFATVGGSQTETLVERKVLASNPIMEAIGNAKTTRNDNSSRFGKYIELGFNRANSIIGAHMRTYLLEKSRVVFQAQDERNYHIFYQMCASAKLPEFKKMGLKNADDFFYTAQGGAPEINDVNDAEDLISTREAMTTLGLSEQQQMVIFQILAAVLHFGNVSIQECEGETCEIPDNDIPLKYMCKLLAIEESQMKMWLCNRKIQTVNETLNKPLTESQARDARDALAKHIYSNLFNWIVTQVNRALHSASKQHRFIGVLDIYGFETFEINSFEQFCINYANEKLQQIFNMHVFKLEQEEYVKEAIEWSFIDFYDNQPCIDLIESKLGILDLLDEECRMPKGSDSNWCQKLYDKHLGKSRHFNKPRMSRTAFVIIHFADQVTYTADGFLEKNRDTVLAEQINILKASEIELVGELFSEAVDNKKGRGVNVAPIKQQPKAGSKQHKQTVGTQFRESLSLLMGTLNATTPHYIRCIKPNDEKCAFSFDPKRAVEQLRACGVLETIRISAAGYPSRWTYPEYFQRYRVLAKAKQIIKGNMRKTCESIMPDLIDDPDKYRFGKTKIFFRAGQVAYLEKLRSEKLRACGVMIQKHIRGWLSRIKYQKIRKSALLVQCFGRGLLARRHATFLRQTHAATTIQKHWRGYKDRSKFDILRNTICLLQAHIRGLFARRNYSSLLKNHKASIIQRHVRTFLAKKRYKHVIRGIILLQSHYRRRKARTKLKILKVEAKSVDHVKKVNKGLENKIIELQQKLDIKSKEIIEVKQEEKKISELKTEIHRLKENKEVAKESSNKVAELLAEIEKLRTALAKEQTEKQDLITEKELMKQEHNKIVDGVLEEKEQMKNQLNKAKEKLKEAETSTADIVKEKLEAANKLLLAEFASERSHHQKLVKEHGRLQQRLENLQGELQIVTSPTGHQRSSSDISAVSIESYSSSAEAERNNEEKEEDQGYDTVKRKSEAQRPNILDKVMNEVTGRKEADVDVGLLLKLQNKVKDLEKQKSKLTTRIESFEDGSMSPSSVMNDSAFNALKMQELENENDKLKREVKRLMGALADSSDLDDRSGETSPSGKKFMEKFDAMCDELDRRREECLQLRALLADRTISTHTIAKESYSGQDNLVNEDDELSMAYKTQKDSNRLLQSQLEKTEKEAKKIQEELKAEIKELRKDNERQQKLIGQNLSLGPEAKIEATMQHEITRLTSENLDLREEIDKHTTQIRMLKKMVKVYSKKLQAGEAAEIQAELERAESIDSNGSLATVKQKERAFMGMLELKKEDEGTLVKNLILDLKPKVAAGLIPGLPAYVLFMIVRQTDFTNDDEKVRGLLTNTINGIKKVVKRHNDDLERITLWLANTCRLLHTLKQYSGEKAFQTENTPKQNEQCLRNFDLSEYRQVFSDLAVWIYQGLLKRMEELIQPSIVPAILEHEAISGLNASKPSGLRGRASSNARELDGNDYTLDSLMKALNNYMRIVTQHAVDPELAKQIFRQVFYYICAGSLNNLLLRKDMCNWSKGMQIRYNLSHLEQWLRDNKLHESGAIIALDPIIQASQLLQARKTDSDVESISDMCSKLTNAQIVKILNLYTPVDEFEERVPISFIRKIQEKLKSRDDTNNTLLMDTKYSYPVTFPFNPSNIQLESIEVPDVLHLSMLKKV